MIVDVVQRWTGGRATYRPARRRLEEDPHAQAVEVRDLDGRVLERVERPR